MYYFSFFLFICLLFSSIFSQTSEIVSPENLVRTFIAHGSRRTTFSAWNDRFTVNLTLAIDDGCDTGIDDSLYYSGKWVAIVASSCPAEEQRKHIQKTLAQGLIFYDPTGSPLSHNVWYGNGWDSYDDVTIPIFHVGYDEDVVSYLKKGGEIKMIVAEAPNDWEENWFWFSPFYQLVCLPWTAVNGFFCIKALKEYLTFAHSIGDYSPFWLPITCLALELIAAIIRGLFCLDPFGTYGVAPYLWHNSFATLSLPFSLSTTILINLYWQEIITKVKKGDFTITGIKALKIPFFVVVCLLFFIEISATIGRLTGITAATAISAGIYFLLQIIISIFILYTGANLKKQLGAEWSKEKQAPLRKVSRLITWSTLFIAIFVFGTILILFVGATEGGFGFGIFFIGIGGTGSSTLQILAFQRKNRPSESTNSNSSSNFQSEAAKS